MARSQRAKVVHRSQVRPKGAPAKEKLINSVREAATQYRHAIVFSVSNIRNNEFKTLRQSLDETIVIMGKCKVMAIALGLDEDSELREGLHLISQQLKGGAGLLFSNADPQELISTLQGFECPTFARSGFVATQQFELEEGILEDQPFSMETQLRKLGLDTKLDNGKVRLEQDTVVCKKGQVLTPSQCRILEIFGVEMAVMRVHVIAHLDMEEGTFQEYQELDLTGVDDGDYEDDEEMNDD